MGAGPSLFERIGGVYGVAALVDRFIDVTVADPNLTANERIKQAHIDIPKAGFKYLVWEFMSEAFGGPTKYTGRDIAALHKHLCISSKEWDFFVEDFKNVLNEFNVPEKEQEEIISVLGPLRNSVVGDYFCAPLVESDKAPPADEVTDPNSLYNRLGGIYGIAAVSDALVDVMMKDRKLTTNPCVREAHHRVSNAGLKCLLIQQIASAAGGPQVYIGRPMKEAHAHLYITSAEWDAFAADMGGLLKEFQIAGKEEQELFTILNRMRPDIVLDGVAANCACRPTRD